MLDFFLIITETAPFIAVVVAPLVLYFGPGIYHRKKRHPLAYLTGMGINLLAIYSLKFIIGSERPEDMVIDEFGSSFPSAHSALGFYMAGFAQNIRYRAPLLVYAGVVGYSRLYLNVHFLRDVVAGSVIGFLAGYFIYTKRGFLFQKFNKLRGKIKS